MISAVLTLLLSAPSFAATCDARALTTALNEASPQGAPAAFVALAECDAAAAKKAAATAIPRFISGDAANQGVLAALRVGASAEVVAWTRGLQPDDRGSTIAALGAACAKNPPAQTFFLDAAKTMGDAFWNERWYRGLSTCQAPAIQQLLSDQLAKGPSGDASRFHGLLEVYARNLGAAAVPKLKELAVATKDGEIQNYIVEAFSDAAGVGSEAGMNAEAADAAVKAIVAVAPQLQPKSIDKARVALQSLGAERASDELAAVRFAAVKQKEGNFLWGAVVLESAACKNGKTQQVVHVGKVTDPGQTWPDQLQAKVEASSKTSWGFELAEKCKGEGTLSFTVPGEPFADDAGFKAWVDGQIKEIEKTPADKRVRADHDPLKL